MDAFSFVFSLYSIILGLALTQVFGGVARAVEARRKVRIGVSTLLLAGVLISDMTLFWRVVWRARTAMPDNSAALFGGIIICGLYYFAAVLVVPNDLAEIRDLDTHFMAEKSKVLACILLANLCAYAGRTALMGWAGSLGPLAITDWGEIAIFMGSCFVGIFVRNRTVLIALLAAMFAMNLLDPIFTILGIGT